MKAKLVKEIIQQPFTNNTRNNQIGGSYPLSKIQYENSDKKKNKKKFSKRIKKVDEDLSTLGYLSVGYLSGFVLLSFIKFIKKISQRYENFKESKETFSDLFDLIGTTNSSFQIMEYDDRYYITTTDKELEKEIGPIKIFKDKRLMNVLDYNMLLTPDEYIKIINIIKSKL